jgi:hypothetical protein
MAELFEIQAYESLWPAHENFLVMFTGAETKD